MSEERKTTHIDDAPTDCVSDLRRFGRALLGPGLAAAADALAHAALDRATAPGLPAAEIRERAFAEIVRLNRQRLRQRAPHNDSATAPAEPDRRDLGIAALVAAMPLDERETILVVALAEFGYEAAARILEVPQSTVLSRLMRARARLDSVRTGPTSRPGHLRVVK